MPMGQELNPDLRRIARVLPGGPYTRPTLPAIRALARRPGAWLQVFRAPGYRVVGAPPRAPPGIRERPSRLSTPNRNRRGWTADLRRGGPRVAVPARHPALSGLPPAWIGVGTLEPLH